MSQPFTHFSFICGSRGSLAHNHAGWQRLHGSSVHQKAQICRSDFEICRCISKLQLAQNGKYFLILICNLVLYSKFRGASLLRRLRMPFVFFYTDFGNFVYHWLSLVFWVSVFFSQRHELGTPTKISRFFTPGAARLHARQGGLGSL